MRWTCWSWQPRGGVRGALATVVATWGSSPRPPGSQLLADDSGRFMGSVSGGCIEGEVVRRRRSPRVAGAEGGGRSNCV
ncbi:MAG: XdhC family protein [Gammaproteobacteria bacterium]